MCLWCLTAGTRKRSPVNDILVFFSFSFLLLLLLLLIIIVFIVYVFSRSNFH